MIAVYQWFIAQPERGATAFGAGCVATSIVMIPWVALGVMYLIARRSFACSLTSLAVNLPFSGFSQQPGHGCSGSTSGNWVWPVESSAFYDAPYVEVLTLQAFWLRFSGDCGRGFTVVVAGAHP